MKKKFKWFFSGFWNVTSIAFSMVITCGAMYVAFTSNKGWEAIMYFLLGLLGLVAVVAGSALIGRNDEIACSHTENRINVKENTDGETS